MQQKTFRASQPREVLFHLFAALFRFSTRILNQDEFLVYTESKKLPGAKAFEVP